MFLYRLKGEKLPQGNITFMKTHSSVKLPSNYFNKCVCDVCLVPTAGTKLDCTDFLVLQVFFQCDDDDNDIIEGNTCQSHRPFTQT